MVTALPVYSSACGLDFGTSNSTLAASSGGVPHLCALEGERTTVPSAVFFGHDSHNKFLIGRAAIDAYVEGAGGRLMRALKSILGSALLDEDTPIYRRKISFSNIISEYLRELKLSAELQVQTELSQVVLGRPVQFVDNDEAANEMAERNLKRIAQAAGFKEVSFQFEPVAAAREFERHLAVEKLALIADIGGGTSDFSIVRLGLNRQNKERKNDVLANAGIRVGGTDFDRALSMSNVMPHFGAGSLQKTSDLELPSGPFWDLSTWSNIHHLYEPKFMALLRAMRFDAQKANLLDRFIHIVKERRCHNLLMSVEDAKIQLSLADSVLSDLSWVEHGLLLTISRSSFTTSSQSLLDKLQKTIVKCLSDAGVNAEKIEVVFLTGGSSFMPSVRDCITRNFANADIVLGDQFGAVGLGLGLEASNRYG